MVHNNTQQDMPAPAPANSLPIGTRMHEYEIKAVIGEGGFGIVYLAADTLLGREVAIKEYLPISHAKRRDQLHVEARTPEQQSLFEKGLKSFVAEARILAQFRNPNLVEVMRFWEGNGTAYFVMPYYKGKTLRDLLQKGFRVTDQVSLLNLLQPLLSGLKQVHAVGCFHRDISLDNIIVLPDGSPLLLDFGAARHEIIHQADSATVILKPGFAPIEQYGGKETAKQQGPWTDIYALSAVTYQLLTGIAPPSSVARIMRDPLTPLVDQAASLNIPLAILKAIDAGLQVQPQDRPQSIAAFRAMLLAKEPALEPASDEARVHQHPLAAELPVAPVPLAFPVQGAPVTETASQQRPAEAAPVAALLVPANKGVSNYVWAGLVALFVVLALAAFFFWRAQPHKAPEGLTPASSAMPLAAPPALAENTAPPATPAEAQPVSSDNPSTAWPSVVVPLANRAGTAESGPESAIPTVMLPAATAEPEPAVQLRHESSLQANEEFMPDGLLPAQQATAEPPVAIAEPEEVPIPTTGYVVVQAEPWGDVYLNGVLMGTTPPSVRLEVPIGSNTIEVRNDSAPAYTQTLTVQGGQTVRVKHNFVAR